VPANYYITLGKQLTSLLRLHMSNDNVLPKFTFASSSLRSLSFLGVRAATEIELDCPELIEADLQSCPKLASRGVQQLATQAVR
jgi:hypothetical protein